jgi:hypothetical protein
MLKIDAERLLCAFDYNTEVMDVAGYLNKHTGEVIFVLENEGRAEEWCHRDVVVKAVFDRATVEAWPDRYVRIPKYQYGLSDISDQNQVVHKFLQEHGIKALLV